MAFSLNPVPAVNPAKRAFQNVHGRRADKLRHKKIPRSIEKFERGTDLLDDAVMHHHDAVSHGHGLDLIVRHIDGRGFQTLMKSLDFSPHRNTQLGVKIGKRFIEQKYFWIAHDGATHRNALALPARQLARVTIQQRIQIQDAGRITDTLARELGIGLAQLEG